MRRGSADSIRASRYRPAQQAGYKTAAYLNQHTDKDLGKRGGVHVKILLPTPLILGEDYHEMKRNAAELI